MSEWKVLLESKKRKIKNVKSKEERTADVAVIITNDSMQFVLSEFELVDTYTEKDDIIEVDGKIYKQFGGSKKYYSNLVNAIDGYLKNDKILSPSRDILSLKEATNYMLELKELAKELYCIDGSKKK